MDYTFSTAEVQASDRFDFFREAAAKAYVWSDQSVPDVHSFNAQFVVKPIANLNLSVISSNSLHPVIPRPRREMSVPDIVFLKFGVGGCTRIIQDGREAAMHPGEMSILDTARPFTVDIPEASKLFVLELPRAELEARIGPIENTTARQFSSRSTEVAIAFGYLSKLFANPPAAGTDDAAIARQALDVSALALGGGSRDVVRRLSSPAAISRLRLHHAIDFSLGEGHLSCEEVANMAGISTRYANILLAQEGISLERLLMHKRLEKSRAMLADPGNLHRGIAEIAGESGFESASHFARSFKGAYGMTAREFRHLAMQGVVENWHAMSKIAQFRA